MMEFIRDVIELLIADSEQKISALTLHRLAQQPGALRANNYETMNQKLFGFLDLLVKAYN